MLFIPLTELPPAFVSYGVLETEESQQSSLDSDWCGSGTIILSEISVGETTYRLVRPLRATFLPNIDGSGEMHVEGFSPHFVGHGSAWDVAYENFRDLVHTKFQHFYGTRNFEMTNEQQAEWKHLSKLIDTVSYHNTTPISILEVGEISFGTNNIPVSVEWIHGGRERFSLDQVPRSIAGFKPGQFFEGVVERDPVTGSLRRIVDARPISTVHPLRDSELSAFWEQLGTTSRLPESKDV